VEDQVTSGKVLVLQESRFIDYGRWIGLLVVFDDVNESNARNPGDFDYKEYLEWH
jgi:hypothetical protein